MPRQHSCHGIVLCTKFHIDITITWMRAKWILQEIQCRELYMKWAPRLAMFACLKWRTAYQFAANHKDWYSWEQQPSEEPLYTTPFTVLSWVDELWESSFHGTVFTMCCYIYKWNPADMWHINVIITSKRCCFDVIMTLQCIRNAVVKRQTFVWRCYVIHCKIAW